MDRGRAEPDQQGDRLLLAWHVRVAAGLGAGVLLALLVTASWLRPDPTGQGTHQQLGLPPCAWRVILGIPCPTCGMTTAWSHLWRGEIQQSLQANPAGIVAAGMAAALAAGLASSAGRGRWSMLLRVPTAWIAAVISLWAVLLAWWVWRLTGLN